MDLCYSALPIFVVVFTSLLYTLRATQVYVAWSEGWNWPITSSAATSSLVTLLITGTLTLFLYHLILGTGEPLAEQLTRTDAPILDTLIEDEGVEVNTGISRLG